MDLNSRIYVAGHRGLVGSALMRCLQAAGYSNIVTRTHRELDLERHQEVEAFFAQECPEYVLLAAAKVGGIHANNTYPVDFLLNNLKIQNNVIESSWRYGVKGLLFLGSSCIYPKMAPQPLKEESLLTGSLEPTNEAYAIAKISGIKLCEAFNRQYGTRFLSVMPTNLYGPADNYDLQNSHVLPALIRKFHLAKLAAQGNWEAIKLDEQCYGPIPDEFGRSLMSIARYHGHDVSSTATHSYWDTLLPSPAVPLWGTGTPCREFLFSDDLAEACIFLMQNLDKLFSTQGSSPTPCQPSLISPHLVNIGFGEDLTIREIAALVSTTVGFDGGVEWDHSKPDGTPKKLLDVSRLKSMGWRPKISLDDGVRLAYRDYLSSLPGVKGPGRYETHN